MPKPDTYYRQVAEIHIACISAGFLSTLGVDFLALMYRAIDQGKDSLLLIEQVDERVVGFVSASHGMGGIYRRMLLHWPSLLRSLLPVLKSPRRIWRIIEIVRYSTGTSFSHQDGVPKCELLSIAVATDVRRTGHAETLYCRLCTELYKRNVSAFRILVGAALTPAHRFYQKMGAQVIGQLELHANESSLLYVQSLPRHQKARQ